MLKKTSASLPKVSADAPKKSDQNGTRKSSPKVPISQELNSDISGGKSLFEIVEESKEKLAAEEMVPPKNKGGRPKGSSNKPKEASPPLETSAPVSADFTPMLAKMIKVPFHLRAQTLRFPDYELDNDTANMLGAQWNEALTPFMGIINTKWGALAAVAISTGIVVMDRENSYRSYRNAVLDSQAREEIKASDKPQPANPNPSPTTQVTSFAEELKNPPIDASSFFGSREH